MCSLLSATLLALPGEAQAVFRQYLNLGGGAWSNAASWSPVGLPTPADYIDIPAQVGLPFTITMPPSAVGLHLGPRADVTLAGTGLSDTLTLGGRFETVDNIASPQVALSNLSVIAPESVTVGTDVEGTSPRLTLTSASLTSTGAGAGQIYVGNGFTETPGTCRLVAVSSQVTANALFAGPGSTATVSSTNSVFNIAGATTLASDTRSTSLTVAGALAQYNTGSLSLQAIGAGSTTATISNSATAAVAATLAMSGQSQLNVNTGASVSAAAWQVEKGTVNLSDHATISSTATLSQFATNGQTVQITVADNSTIRSTNGSQLWFGSGRGATAASNCSLTLTGTGNRIEGSSFVYFGAAGGSASVDVQGTSATIYGGNTDFSAITVGSGRDMTGNVDRGGSVGAVSLKNMSSIDSRNVVIGEIGGKGQVDADGPGTEIRAEVLNVGVTAAILEALSPAIFPAEGTLSITGGARVVGQAGAVPSVGVHIGSVGAKGVVNVQGNNSLLRGGPRLSVGDGRQSFATLTSYSDGTLNILAGGTVDSTTLLTIGNGSGKGVVTLSGAGSTLAVSGTLRIGDALPPSPAGRSTLSLGAATQITAGTITTGLAGPNNVTVNMTGGRIDTGSVHFDGIDTFNWTAGEIHLTSTGSDFFGRCQVPHTGYLYVESANGLANGQAIDNDGTTFFYGSNNLARIDQTSFGQTGSLYLLNAGTIVNTARVRQAVTAVNEGTVLRLTGDSTLAGMSYIGIYGFGPNTSKLELGKSGVSMDSGEVAFWSNAIGTRVVSANVDSAHNIGLCPGTKLAPGLLADMNAAGVLVHSYSTVLRYTLRGDANLDLIVNFDDLLALAANYGQTTTQYWYNGDSNYDGVTDFTDLLALASNYNQTLTGNSAGDWALAQPLVPEPSMALLLIVPIGALGRRRASERH
jgi:hypothetical protein